MDRRVRALHAACLLILFSALVVIAGPASASIEVVGLFKDRAVVRSPAGDELIRVGETSRGGVTLVRADTGGAVVRYRGETQRLSLSNRVGSRFTKNESRSISINADSLGQYRVQGFINERRASFLVDTGASVVALSGQHARSLGIDYSLGQQGTVVTAQGEVGARFITLSTVNVGGVTAHNVAATVIEGNYPVDILLGMSYLNKVNMQNAGGVLTITRR